MPIDLEHIRVRDAMHPGIMSCSADASLRDVAAIMSARRVHAVAVYADSGSGPAGVISDVDLVAAIAGGDASAAEKVATSEPLTVSSDARLDRAAQLMAEHSIAHLVVVDAGSGRPVGVISALDLATVYAGGPV
ncbi:MAG: CBS domain-containing protein [Solirubrobacteraceae bacterium]